MKRLNIIGASGHGKVVADIAKLNGYDEIVFYDDDTSIKGCGGWPVRGTSSDVPEGDVFIAIGNAKIRRKLMACYAEREIPILIHPAATIANGTKIGRGTVVMAGAVINPDVSIGQGCIINTLSSVDHDCIVDDYVHLAVASHLCGTVRVGSSTWVGAGSIVNNNISITDDCVIGAGTVVIKNIDCEGTYVGVPAKRLR